MRGHFRGGMRGGFMGGGPPSAPFQARPPPFDIYNTNGSFERVNVIDEAPLTKEVLAVSQTLTPSSSERQDVANLVAKVKAALDKYVGQADAVPNVKIDQVLEVGSFRKDTILAGHRTADIAVILATMPTFEAVTAIGKKLGEDLRAQKEVISCVSRDFGIQLSHSAAHVRLLISTIPSNVALLETDVHLAERVMMLSYLSTRHAVWFEEASQQAAVKDLVRVVKDVRRRFTGLQHLSVWTVEFLCFYCLCNTPTHSAAMSLGPAFRRFFEVLSAGIFLPGSSPLIDPTEPRAFIAFDMTLPQMDEVCMTAQNLLRVISHGGYATVLGTVPAKAGVDISKDTSMWNGVVVSPPEKAYTEDCMKPLLSAADEGATSAISSASAVQA